MSNDKTLATVKHGGCVQLGDGLHVPVLREMRARFTDSGSPARTAALDAAIDALSVKSRISSEYEEDRFETWAVSEGWERSAMHRSQGEYKYETIRDMWRAWQAALSAQPSPGGQGDALLESLVARWRNHAEEIGVSGNLLCQKIANCTMRHAAELQAALATRQPVGQPVPREMETAPRDGTMVRLLVQFEENPTEDSFEPAWTIGACNDDNVGEDERVGWKFAGWCWTHDHFTEGKGTPVGWLPLIDSQAVGNG